MQVLDKLIIETIHPKDYVKDLLSDLCTKSDQLKVKLNSFYTRTIIFCEGLINKKKVLTGTFLINNKTIFVIYQGKTENFMDLFFSLKMKYEIFDHITKSSQSHIRKFFNRTILLYGKPGTGKTSLCHAICKKAETRKSDRKIHFMNCSSFISKYYGESMKLINDFFKCLDKHSLVIADEIETLLSRRENFTNDPLDSLRVVNSFLVQLDNSNAFFMFTTNLISNLDTAFLDRMDLIIEMPIVNQIDIKVKMLKNFFLNLMINNVIDYKYLFSEDLRKLAEIMKNMSFRSIQTKIVSSLNSRNIEVILKEIEKNLE